MFPRRVTDMRMPRMKTLQCLMMIVPSAVSLWKVPKNCPADTSFTCQLLIFHFFSFKFPASTPNFSTRFCLRSWLAHHSSCPTCRRPLTPSFQTHSPHRLNIQLDQFILNPPNMHHVGNAFQIPHQNLAPLHPDAAHPVPPSGASRDAQHHAPAPLLQGIDWSNWEEQGIHLSLRQSFDRNPQPPAEDPPAAPRSPHVEGEGDEDLDVGDEYGYALPPSGGNTPMHFQDSDREYSDANWGSPSGEQQDREEPTSARTRARIF